MDYELRKKKWLNYWNVCKNDEAFWCKLLGVKNSCGELELFRS